MPDLTKAQERLAFITFCKVLEQDFIPLRGGSVRTYSVFTYSQAENHRLHMKQLNIIADLGTFGMDKYFLIYQR